MKNLILLFCFLAMADIGYSQLKVFSNGTTVAGNNSGFASSAKQFTISDNGGVNQLHFGRSPAGLANSYNLFDITPGPTGSLRIGSFNFNNNGIGGAGFQAWSDSSPNALAGAFFFDAGSAATGEIIFRTALVKRMVVSQAGFVGINNSAPTCELDVTGTLKVNGMSVSSDKKLKSNINSFDLGLDAVLQLNPVSYEYNGKGGTIEGGKHVGIVAQELRKVAPMLVDEYTHTVLTDAKEVSPETNEIVSQEKYLSIKDNEIKYMLINAIQDQQALIEDQAQKIAQLEEAISTLGSTESVNNTNVTLSAYDLAELDQNTPNPFNGQTTISYVVPTDAQNALINVYGQSGQLMKTIDIDHVGEGNLTVNADSLPSGTYSYQLVVDGRKVQTNKMVVAK